MNTIHGRSRFKNFRIILGSRCRSTIGMGSIVEKIHTEKYAMIKWHTQAGNITNNIKVRLYFTLLTLSKTFVVTCKCHVDDSTKGRYDMILGRDMVK